MRTIQSVTATEYLVAANLINKQKERQTVPKLEQKESNRDLAFNVGIGESIKRGYITIFLPWSVVFTHNPYLIIAIIPVMFYLFISALTHFCFIRYAWQHWIKHMKTPTIFDFAPDMQIPVETV